MRVAFAMMHQTNDRARTRRLRSRPHLGSGPDSHPLAGLLDYCRNHIDAERQRVKDWESLTEPSDRESHHLGIERESVAKWQSWAEALQDVIASER